MKFGVVIVAAGLAAFSGCGSTTDGSSAPTTASGSDVPTTRTPPSDSPASDSSPVPVTPSFGATLGAPIEGWTEPVDMAALPGATFVVERGGTIRTMAADGSPGPVALDLSALTRPGGEQGLLGLAFSPDGRNAYVNYTNATGDTVIAEFAVRADRTFDESSRRTLLTIAQPYPNHNGGDLLVSPDGSDLLVFTGDGGAAGDPQRLALDPNSFLGKIVRIDPAAPGASASVWAVGLRNPWRVSYDATRGDLWIADVGQDSYEEIDRIPLQSSRGASFGWSAREATHAFNADQDGRDGTYRRVEPIHEYPHSDSDCSIAGGAVYRGTRIPVVGDWYVFSDYCSGRVRALCADTEGACGVVDIGRVPQSVAVVGDANGELWVLSLDGRLVPLVSDR